MTPFVKEARRKGWKAKELAERWGITPRRLSQVAKDPTDRDWDALAGVPVKIQERKK